MWKGGRSLRQKQQNIKNQHDKKKIFVIKNKKRNKIHSTNNNTTYIVRRKTNKTKET